jgi:hypothetical protein
MWRECPSRNKRSSNLVPRNPEAPVTVTFI